MLVCKASDGSLLDLCSEKTMRDAIMKGDHVSINGYDSWRGARKSTLRPQRRRGSRSLFLMFGPTVYPVGVCRGLGVLAA